MKQGNMLYDIDRVIRSGLSTVQTNDKVISSYY